MLKTQFLVGIEDYDMILRAKTQDRYLRISYLSCNKPTK